MLIWRPRHKQVTDRTEAPVDIAYLLRFSGVRWRHPGLLEGPPAVDFWLPWPGIAPDATFVTLPDGGRPGGCRRDPV